MNRIAIIVSASLLLSGGVCFARDFSYQGQVKELAEQVDSLNESVKSNGIDFISYDKWFKGFKSLSEPFVKDFAQVYIKKESFQTVQQGINQLGLLWNALKQAQYAEDQYKEFITSGDVSYAHKWKSTASEQRKKALDTIPEAIEYFHRAREIAAYEN